MGRVVVSPGTNRFKHHTMNAASTQSSVALTQSQPRF